MTRRSAPAMLTFAAALLLPAAGFAQDVTPSSAPTTDTLITSLCSVATEDEAEQATCLEDVEAALEGLPGAGAEMTEAQRVARIVDDAVAVASGLDVPGAIAEAQAALDEIDIEAVLRDALADAGAEAEAAANDVRASLDELDLRALIDEALAEGADTDIEAWIDEAIDSAEEVDLGAAVDDLMATVESSESYVAIEQGITTARAVVETAQSWVEENPDEACNAGAFTVGAGAATVVGLLTDSPGFAFAAYGQTHKVVEDACSAFVG